MTIQLILNELTTLAKQVAAFDLAAERTGNPVDEAGKEKKLAEADAIFAKLNKYAEGDADQQHEFQQHQPQILLQAKTFNAKRAAFKMKTIETPEFVATYELDKIDMETFCNNIDACLNHIDSPGKRQANGNRVTLSYKRDKENNRLIFSSNVAEVHATLAKIDGTDLDARLRVIPKSKLAETLEKTPENQMTSLSLVRTDSKSLSS